VRRRGQLAGRDEHAIRTDGLGAGVVSEWQPRRVHLALRTMVPFHVVPVRDSHARDSSYGFDRSMVKAPRPESRLTFSVSARSPHPLKRTDLPRETSVEPLYSCSCIFAFVGETRLATNDPSSCVFTANVRTAPFPNDPCSFEKAGPPQGAVMSSWS